VLRGDLFVTKMLFDLTLAEFKLAIAILAALIDRCADLSACELVYLRY